MEVTELTGFDQINGIVLEMSEDPSFFPVPLIWSNPVNPVSKGTSPPLLRARTLRLPHPACAATLPAP
jgi:hypothetical protein